MRSMYSIMSDWGKAAQRKCGFGCDAAIDRLRVVQQRAPANEIVRWHGASNFFTVCARLGTDSKLRPLHTSVADTLIRTARAGLIDVYSSHENDRLPRSAQDQDAFAKAATEVSSSLLGPGLHFGKDMHFYYRTADVAEAVQKVCDELKRKDPSLVEEYADIATIILGRNKYAEHCMRSSCINPKILRESFTTTDKMYQISRVRPPEFTALMDKCGVPVNMI